MGDQKDGKGKRRHEIRLVEAKIRSNKRRNKCAGDEGDEQRT